MTNKRLLIYFLYSCFLLVLIPGNLKAAIQGTVYRDYNGNSFQDMFEPGVESIIVNAYDSNNILVGSSLTLSDGTYSLDVNPGGIDVRVEFVISANLYPVLFPGPVGSQSMSGVVFVSDGAISVNYGVSNPGQFCQDPDATIFNTCFVFGNTADDEPTIFSFTENQGSNSDTAADDYVQMLMYEAEHDETGSVWGLAYRSIDNRLFASSFVKRHSKLGSTANPTTIYVKDLNLNTFMPWFTLDPVAIDPHSGATDGWERDFDAFDDVFKAGLGDIDISEDQQSLYAIDLGTRDFVEISINNDGTPGSVNRIPIVSAVQTQISSCPASDIRPFGLGVNDGKVYIGVVCSAQSTVDTSGFPLSTTDDIANIPGNKSLLMAYVFVWDGVAGFSSVLSFPLDYDRGCNSNNNLSTCNNVMFSATDWRPWVDQYPYHDECFTTMMPPPMNCEGGTAAHFAAYAQPIISDIEFDNGNISIALMDRWAHQTGPSTSTPPNAENFPPDSDSDGHLEIAYSSGDILRACQTGINSWEIEKLIDPDSQCDTAGEESNAGSSFTTDEYFFEDNYTSDALLPFNNGSPGHAETSVGGIIQIPGRPYLIAGAFNAKRGVALELDEGGINWFNNSDGTWLRGLFVYQGGAFMNDTGFFGKAAGLGDFASLCEPPSVEIGNRLWIDQNPNGVQDPGEPPIPGVVVGLYDNNGMLLTTVITDSNGNYLFSSDPTKTDTQSSDYGIVELTHNQTYFVGVLPNNFNGGILTGLTATIADATAGNASDNNDSDGVILSLNGSNILAVMITTGIIGENNHSYDFGFRTLPPDVSVPTVSEWGILILSVLLGIVIVLVGKKN